LKKCWKLKNYFEANGKNTERSPFFSFAFFCAFQPAGRPFMRLMPQHARSQGHFRPILEIKDQCRERSGAETGMGGA